MALLRRVRLGGTLCAALFVGCGAPAALTSVPLPPPPQKTQAAQAVPADHNAGLRWFRDARFGVFLHWGIYSVPAGEWKGNKNYGEWFQIETRMPGEQYAKFADQLNPDQFNAKDWVRQIKEAGFKYVVITTKHHDGFAMFDSKLTDYSIVKATPWKRDPMKELAAACKDSGVQLCFYYSIPDWHSPEFPAAYSQRKFHGNPNPNAEIEKYVAYMKGQIRELLTQYGPIGYLWFDDGGSFEGLSREQRAKIIHAQEIIDMIHELQPQCIINDRLGLPGDLGTPEQHIPGGRSKQLFEVCMTLNNHWSFNKNDHNWKSPTTVVRNLVDIAGKGGNYLLGIGPTPAGTLPPEAMSVLATVGKWMSVNGESIYGTTASPFSKLSFDGRCTQKPGVVYLHVFTWPKDRRLYLPMDVGVIRAYLLADAKRTPLPVVKTDASLVATLPAEAPDAMDSVIAVEIESPTKTP